MKILSRSHLALMGALVGALVGALALGLVTTACGSGVNLPTGQEAAAMPTAPANKPAAVVELKHFSFDPSFVTVKAGQTVEWIWRDPGVPNNVTFASFHSPTRVDGVYYHTFTKPGTYDYSCTLHYNMSGEVIVSPG
ncbi:MAG: plastocyanin/azurin family copper-binding protein [Acidimicrobiales bacterium]